LTKERSFSQSFYSTYIVQKSNKGKKGKKRKRVTKSSQTAHHPKTSIAEVAAAAVVEVAVSGTAAIRIGEPRTAPQYSRKIIPYQPSAAIPWRLLITIMPTLALLGSV